MQSSKLTYFFLKEQKEIVQMGLQESYLRAILSTVARQAFPPSRLVELLAPTSRGEKQVAAYNLCDGEHTQSQIASAVGIDKSDLSKAIAKWIEHGIVFRVNDGTEKKPVHVYPLPRGQALRKKGKKNGK